MSRHRHTALGRGALLGGIGIFGVAMIALSSHRDALAQLALIAGVRLQNATPGTSDSGNANLSGTLLVGTRIGIGTPSPSSPLHVNGTITTSGLQMANGAAAGRVLTSDALGNATWQTPSGGGFILPYTGSASQPGSGVFEVTNSANGSGWGVRGHSASTTSGQGAGVYGTAVSGFGVYGLTTDASASTSGVWGQSASLNGRGVVGYSTALSGNNAFGVVGQSDSTGGSGVFGYVPFGTGSSGVLGKSDGGNGVGVRGIANTGGFASGVWGESATGYGVYADSVNGGGAISGVFGRSGGNHGNGVIGEANVGSSAYGVWGRSTSGIGVVANGTVTGLRATASAGRGIDVSGGPAIWAQATGLERALVAIGSSWYAIDALNNTAAFATIRAINQASGGGIGVLGQADFTNGYAVFADGRFAANGTKSFHIDHPLDPEDKYLDHYCTEGAEPLNVYRGNVTLGESGAAWIQLPDYFSAINRGPSYQLTAIGAPAPNLHVSQEIEGNRFQIAGGGRGQRISWRVEAVRNDRFVQEYGAPTERAKPERFKGKYLQPELYGMPRERGEHYAAPQSTLKLPSKQIAGRPSQR